MSEDIMTAEVIETSEELDHTPHRSLPQPQNGTQGGALALFGTTDPVEVIEKAKAVAKALMGPVEEQHLYLEKQNGSRYLQVEAWTLLASMLQVRAIPIHTRKEPDHTGHWVPPKYRVETQQRHSKWCKNGATNRNGEATHPQTHGCKTYEKEAPILEEPGHGGYTARVEARDAGGNLIGAADSQCMWEEWAWRDRDAYAVQSMAQTRGISKALSGPLRFIVELAGFKGTPAEEVDDDRYGRNRDTSDTTPDTTTGPDAGLACPSCGSGCYDNREDNDRRRETGEDVKTPAFRCGNKTCTGGKEGRPWATWDPHHFTDPTTRAKQLVYKAVKANLDGWVRQYPADDPSWSDRERELVTAAHEGTAKEKAGWLWHRLRLHTDIIGWAQGDDEEPTEEQAAAIAGAAELMLAAAEPLSELEALEQANG